MTTEHTCGSAGWTTTATSIQCNKCGCTWRFEGSEWYLDQDTDPTYLAFIAECASECECQHGPCGGITAGGFCDSAGLPDHMRYSPFEHDAYDESGHDDWAEYY